MNKIFKIVWNQSTQTWTAVSELAKGYVKSSNDNTSQTTVSKLGAVFKLSTLTLGLVASMPNAYANLTIDALASNTIKLSGTTGSTDAQNLNKTGGLEFKVVGVENNGITTSATGDTVTIGIADKGITSTKIADKTLGKDQIVTGNIVSKTTALTVTNGTNRLVGTEDLELSLATTTLTNNADNKVEVNTAKPDSLLLQVMLQIQLPQQPKRRRQ